MDWWAAGVLTMDDYVIIDEEDVAPDLRCLVGETVRRAALDLELERTPAVRFAVMPNWGSVSVKDDGAAVVYIHPGLDAITACGVALHETKHVWQHSLPGPPLGEEDKDECERNANDYEQRIMARLGFAADESGRYVPASRRNGTTAY